METTEPTVPDHHNNTGGEDVDDGPDDNIFGDYEYPESANDVREDGSQSEVDICEAHRDENFLIQVMLPSAYRAETLPKSTDVYNIRELDMGRKHLEMLAHRGVSPEAANELQDVLRRLRRVRGIMLRESSYELIYLHRCYYTGHRPLSVQLCNQGCVVGNPTSIPTSDTPNPNPIPKPKPKPQQGWCSHEPTASGHLRPGCSVLNARRT